MSWHRSKWRKRRKLQEMVSRMRNYVYFSLQDTRNYQSCIGGRSPFPPLEPTCSRAHRRERARIYWRLVVWDPHGWFLRWGLRFFELISSGLGMYMETAGWFPDWDRPKAPSINYSKICGGAGPSGSKGIHLNAHCFLPKYLYI